MKSLQTTLFSSPQKVKSVEACQEEGRAAVTRSLLPQAALGELRCVQCGKKVQQKEVVKTLHFLFWFASVLSMVVGAAAAVMVAVVPPVGLGDDLSLNGGGDVGDGVAALVVAAGGGCASHGRESGRGRASEHRGVSRRRGWRGESRGASGRVLAGLGSDRRGGRAESDGDIGVLRASLHTVGVVGSVTVSLLLRRAGTGLRVGSDHPVAVPWVAVDLAQVVPDGAVILEGVLVLEDVVQILVL